MNTYADKTQENKSESLANEASQEQSGGESTFQLVNDQPEAVAKRKTQDMANNSPKIGQLRALQEMTNNSLQVKQFAQLQDMADNYTTQQQPIQNKENNASLEKEADLMGAAPNIRRELSSDGQTRHTPLQRRAVTEDSIIQRKLLEDLTSEKKAIAIAGENHSKVDRETEESAWGRFDIKVGNENSEIEYLKDQKEKVKITPDDPLFRTWFGYVSLKSAFKKLQELNSKIQHVNPLDLALDEKENPNEEIEENIDKELSVISEIFPRIIGSAQRSKEMKLKGIIDHLKSLEYTFNENTRGRRRDIDTTVKAGETFISEWDGTLSGTVKEYSDHDEKNMLAENSDIACMLRSRRMLTNLIEASSGLKRFIYKMGEQHVEDIKNARMEIPGNMDVYKESDYQNELKHAEDNLIKFEYLAKKKKRDYGHNYFDTEDALEQMRIERRIDETEHVIGKPSVYEKSFLSQNEDE